jgi:hypothetical protein
VAVPLAIFSATLLVSGASIAGAATHGAQAATAQAAVVSCAKPVYADPKAPAGQPVTVSAQLGQVKATLSGTAVKGDGGGFDSVRRPTIDVSVSGGRSTRYSVAPAPGGFPGGPAAGGLLLNPVRAGGDYPLCVARFGPSSVTVALLGLFTGGAHCCSWLYAYPAMPSEAVLAKPVEQAMGDPGASIEGLGSSAIVLTADDRFAYQFDSFAASGMPLRLLSFQSGKFMNVTSQHLELVAKDAKDWWSAYQQAQAPSSEGKGGGLGLLAPWVADECLFGKGPQAWKTVAALEARGQLSGGKFAEPSVWPTGAKYVAALRKFLAQTGYCPA